MYLFRSAFSNIIRKRRRKESVRKRVNKYFLINHQGGNNNYYNNNNSLPWRRFIFYFETFLMKTKNKYEYVL
jgi:hypothetical protein